MDKGVFYSEVSGVILAGGKSRRMGSDKALLSVDGKPLIQRLVEQILLVAGEVWISANDPEPYRFLGLPVITDVFRDRGPLAGIHSAMLRIPSELLIVLACDLPRVRAPLLRALLEHLGDSDAILPRTGDGRLHPLCAVYRRTCLQMMEQNLQREFNKVTDIFETGPISMKWLTPEEGEFGEHDLDNLNSPEDLARFTGNL